MADGEFGYGRKERARGIGSLGLESSSLRPCGRSNKLILNSLMLPRAGFATWPAPDLNIQAAQSFRPEADQCPDVVEVKGVQTAY
jgi:hypothetical protein